MKETDKCPRCGGELTICKSIGGGDKGDMYICTKCRTKIYDGGILPPDDIIEYMSGKN